MQVTYNIRKFALNDLRSVMNINLECLPENYTDSFFVDLYRRFPETFIVAEQNDVIIGYAICRMELELSSFGLKGFLKKGHIVSLAVNHAYRRNGVSEALLTRLLEGMRVYNADQCFLEVRVTNIPAINLYTKFGFQIKKTRSKYYSDNEDAYVMSFIFN